MREGNDYVQTGMTLIEVLIALLILAIGLLGAAALQLNALKYTDSAMLHSHASFVAHDMMERIRANPDVDYTLASLASAPPVGNLAMPRDQDLFDFATSINAFAGNDADASIAVIGRAVEITITWNDSRAANVLNELQTFRLSSRVAVDVGARP
ncbi:MULTISPECIES: type IV pilus modification protein PilV [unclassified Pseudomonas]|uniref:type IV pilus modification protein PilV n=1 Tax=unclassified Pseudomonas TaxID=196821 RepID=UPI002AC993F5|nr:MULTISPECIES: type IV pilus modification protein PilV [unclassified Pseudomonas]MEB0042456.1 type IV pilus modification protein PilV [Pseudomonas sp. MH10]MEB0076773.1 type IV pilus modification protein PilV [Pseudomonas sp. MH10out]MEB0090981.1 type IV pilus modification protein PilV [Pseudomonas sp. CCI4.2]MEB0101906.1 type IV pilus modification protein PilV [Pseudomonas sp. CCI3.2]MEB0121864.1 type IV pilus modification protein PilV [Pseudomonas sp. CCI1.2]